MGEFSVFGYGFTIVFRSYVAGITFILWSKKRIKDDNAVAVGAIFFSLCGYALNMGVEFPTFMTPFSFLPLIAYGIDKIFDENNDNKSVLMVLGIFLTVLCGFQWLYIEAVFFFFYIIGIIINELHTSMHVRIVDTCGYIGRKLAIIIVHILLGVGISCIELLPKLYSTLVSSRSNVSVSSILRFFSASQIIERMKGLITGNQVGTGLFIGALGICSIIKVFENKGESNTKFVLVSMLAGHFILAFHILMNCFIYSDFAIGRWEYVLYIIVAYIIALFLQGNCILETNKGKIIYLIFMILNGLFIFQMGESWIQTHFISVCLWIVIWMFPFFGKLVENMYYRKMAMLLVVVQIALFSYPLFSNGSRFVPDDLYEKIKASNFAAFSEVDSQKGFLRTSIFDSTSSAAMILKKSGTSSYISIQNENLYNFFKDMASSTSIFGGNVNMGGLDGRKSLDVIMSVGTYADVGNASILHNNYDMQLPIGFAYDSYMLNSESLKLDPLVRSNGVMNMVYLDEKPEKNIDAVSINQTDVRPYETIPIEIDYSEVVKDGDWIEIKDNSDIYVRYPEGSIINDEKTEYYLFIKSIEMDRPLSTIDFSRLKTIRFTPAGEAANEKGEYLIKLAINDDVAKSGYIDLSPLDGKYRFGDIELRRLDISGYSDSYEELTRNTLEDVTFTPNKVAGRIRSDGDKILFMSILYDKRWKCSIDGQAARVIRANSGFSAVEIGEGEHNIVFEYDMTLNKVALCISLGTMLAMAIYFYASRKGKYSK